MNIEKEYLEKNLKALDGWSLNVDTLTTKLSHEFLGDLNDNIKTNVENEIKTILTNYKNDKSGSITMDDVYDSLTSLSTKQVEESNTNVTPQETEDDINNIPSIRIEPDENGRYSYKDYTTDEDGTINYIDNSTNSNSGDIVDFDTDTASEASQMAKGAVDIISGSTIGIPGAVEPYCGNLDSVANEAVSKVESSLSDFTNAMGTISNTVEGLDDMIEAVDRDWGNINKWKSYNRDYDSQIVEANEEFFKDCGYDVVNGIVTVKDDSGNTIYEYDLNTKILTSDGKKIECTFYVPVNGHNSENPKEYYKKLNTYTYFTMSATKEENDTHYDKYITDPDNCGRGKANKETFNGNAIIIQIDKRDVAKEKSGDNDDNMFISDEGYSMVPETTKFINHIASTDLTNNHCRNIIGGDSKFGAYALGIAADNGDLYKTVYCVNNAICVNKDNPENAITLDDGTVLKGNVSGTTKTQLTMEQIRNLSGKDIYMIYASGDDNQNHDGTWKLLPDSSTALRNALSATGLDYLCNATSADTNINIIRYVDQNKHTLIRKIFGEKDQQYDNLHYYEDVWDQFARNPITTHTGGNWLITELLEAYTTNCNYYFNDGSYNVE